MRGGTLTGCKQKSSSLISKTRKLASLNKDKKLEARKSLNADTLPPLSEGVGGGSKFLNTYGKR
jgi:hypothetical protein